MKLGQFDVNNWIAGVLLMLSAVCSAAEPLTPEKMQDTKKLLEVTGALKVGQSMSEAIVNQMSQSLKKARPDIPDKAFGVIASEVNKTIADEIANKNGLIDMMVGLYHKHFTHQEIREMIAFYQTPTGKKVGALAPVISQEGFAIGQQWGQSLAPVIGKRVQDRLRKEGFQI